MQRYRVEVVMWDGADDGPGELEARLNEWAEDGWELQFIVPTRADTSVKALVASAHADTRELAVVLSRSAPPS